jgi:hypothetical protein
MAIFADPDGNQLMLALDGTGGEARTASRPKKRVRPLTRTARQDRPSGARRAPNAMYAAARTRATERGVD